MTQDDMISRSCHPLRGWWDTVAGADDQRNLLAKVSAPLGLADMPWAFLPETVQHRLASRFRYVGNLHTTQALEQ